MNETVLRARYEHRFDQYDTDGDGKVGRSDFAARAARLLQSLGNVGGAKAENLLNGAQACWAGVAAMAGADDDGLLSREQFVQALLRTRAQGSLRQIVEPSATVATVSSPLADDTGPPCGKDDTRPEWKGPR
ncbi:EF-hand domain-containing protein [Kitasatospora purpeofusca]|uniref:hypothetical protein n=1 Tax=Kitasatospora purpeofusca TaxID=67352 RepID=UPI00364F98CE